MKMGDIPYFLNQLFDVRISFNDVGLILLTESVLAS
ncbi:hypothetical protein SAMN04488552_2297 [Christiangramia echinicola]|uniref:Uncharacterized protein n=1 Tax=Christiangramia echinicola TaxID=279359 RepID=A0A1H1PXT6_9FLAO|nr:hypothetical protein SAMN04488552_2297 [Christiangramia echinicola]